jgi:protein subunit release factor A
MKRIMEIKPAEGGRDSQLFAQDLSEAYIRYFAALG